MSILIKVDSVYKSFDKGVIKALKDINLTIEAGKMYALIGPSGCGKSTLINMIGTLDLPDKGEILYSGNTLDKVGPLNEFRSKFFGYIFQFHHLIPILTLFENVESALLIRKELTAKTRKTIALEMLDQLGISHRANNYANTISGGERQRGAIARALINKPMLILADEPTGNVDSKTASSIIKIMKNYVEDTERSLLIATHDNNIAKKADVVIQMMDGEVLQISEH